MRKTVESEVKQRRGFIDKESFVTAWIFDVRALESYSRLGHERLPYSY